MAHVPSVTAWFDPASTHHEIVNILYREPEFDAT